VESAIVELARRNACSRAQLLQRVREDRLLLLDLVGQLTVGETHFLRHPAHFELLTRLVGNRLADFSGPVRLWSAGCASGEEPYSMALSIDASFGEAALSRVQILATDVDPDSLAKARAAAYGAWSFRGTPSWVLARYFESDAQLGCVVTERIRRAVTFERAGILQHARRLETSSLDIVFFRNVAIYLLPGAVDTLYAEFRRVLRQDGMLVVGPSDPRPSADLFVVGDTESTSVFVVRPAEPSGSVEKAGRRRPKRGRSRDRARAVCRQSRGRTARRRSRHRAGAATPDERELRPAAPPPIAATARPSVEQPWVAFPQLDVGVAQTLADNGDTRQALAVATNLINREPSSPAAYLLRGQILLSDAQNREAVEDLRRATFLGPDHCLARYWYAAALQASGAAARALRQLGVLEARLLDLAAESLVEDDQTRVAELLDAVLLMKESYQ
jgi:chemotaxis protein methyltransferase CheR